MTPRAMDLRKVARTNMHGTSFSREHGFAGVLGIAALLAVGAQPGKPVEFQPTYKPATGTEITRRHAVCLP